MNAPAAGQVYDLHSHSTVSDGVLRPADVAARAHRNGVQVWALTDHDETGGLPEAAEAASVLGMGFVPGVEISVTWASRTVHVVGLNIDPGHAGLNAGLAATRACRAERAQRMGQRLAELGMPGCYEGALPYADNPELVSRTHFARYMVDSGLCPDLRSVFNRYLADGMPADVPIRWASLEDCMTWILAAGGVAVLAHPGRYKYSELEFDALYGVFRDLGGSAIEVIAGGHTPEQYVEYAHIARHYGFLASTGSDFHSPTESRVDLGQLPPLPPMLTPVWTAWS
ncbi:MAG: PHP domain-containing protein [Corticimicrobacter sp.]|uniref:PHP domain-containing protein n=1 Tax=Corticimicrobacter sp. TaxID=2678536 RepID=UPI0032DA8F21